MEPKSLLLQEKHIFWPGLLPTTRTGPTFKRTGHIFSQFIMHCPCIIHLLHNIQYPFMIDYPSEMVKPQNSQHIVNK